MECTAQAFEEMQEQNIRLLQQLKVGGGGGGGMGWGGGGGGGGMGWDGGGEEQLIGLRSPNHCLPRHVPHLLAAALCYSLLRLLTCTCTVYM